MTIGQWLSFRGRIGRRTFWLGYVLILFAAALVAAILDSAMGFTGRMGMDAMPADAGQFTPVSTIVSLLSIWPSLAGSIKRLHDRDRSGWWIGGLYLIGAIFGVVIGVMVATNPQNAGAVLVPMAVGGLVVLAYGIWLLVETGFLRGTPGPNRFGPDPLGGAYGSPQWQQGMPPQWGWPQQPGQPQQWQQPGQWQQPQQQPQWQPPQPQGWQPPPQQPGWQAPPQGYPPPQNPGAPPPGYGQPPQQPGQWGGPGPGGSVPPVRRD